MHRSKHQYWLILVVSLIAVSSFSVFLTRRAALPTDGMRISRGGIEMDGVTLESIGSGGMPADSIFVIAVEGIPIDRWAESLIGRSPGSLSWEMGDGITYTILQNGARADETVALRRYPIWQAFLEEWGTIVYGFVFFVVGVYVFLRRPENRAGRVLFLASACILAQTAWSFGLTLRDLLDGTGFWLYWVGTFVFYNLNWIALFHFSLVFPQPAPVLRRRWLLPVVYLAPMATLLTEKIYVYAQADSILAWLSSPSVVEGLHPLLFILISLTAVVWQARNNATHKEQQQIRWLLLSALAMGIAVLLLYILPAVLGTPQVDPNILGLVIIPFPVSLAIAILRHNIFDIDKLLNRALVYGALSLGTILLYTLIVGTLANRLGVQDRSLIAFLTTGLVAVLFQPLRERLQRGVNRLMYGDRDDPYTVVSRLGDRLEAVYGVEDVIETILETLLHALKLPYAAIQLQNSALISRGALPENTETKSFPLKFRGEVFGELLASPRATDEPFSPSEQQLLANLTRQIESAIHTIRLMRDLQRARQKLVTTREEERRRIRRDLHDGLGPTLASQALLLETIEDLLRPDEVEALELLKSLQNQSREALENVRRLVYALRPPELDNLGLVESLRQSMDVVSQRQIEVVFDVPEPLPELPAAVELAAYRIVQEALTNVIKHAGASQAVVRFEVLDNALVFSVRDDGKQLPENLRPGVGLKSMHERAEEIGGVCEVTNSGQKGACVSASLPLMTDFLSYNSLA